ncbi:MAG: hypothetical protein Q8K63_06475 [Acidimicrobiales bacterium]|nr:hypothetical protein [Acidimicrobiales bacterium]
MPRRLIVAWLVIAFSLVGPSATARQSDSACDRFGEGSSVARVKSAKLTEISGLVASRRHPGVYWAHNDSGGKPEVFALRLDGTDLGSYPLSGASARDWEDIAIGPKVGASGPHLYAGDIGDNNDRRDHVTIYRVPEPAAAPVAPGRSLTGGDSFDLRYPAGPENAESLLVDPVTGDLVIITKSILGRSRILTAPSASMVNGATVTMQDRGVVRMGPAAQASGPLVTGADISADGSLILVRTYGTVSGFERAPGQAVAAALRSAACSAPHVDETQGEAIAIAVDGSRYVTISEGARPSINVFPIAGTRPTAAPAASTTATPRPSMTVAEEEPGAIDGDATRPVVVAVLLIAGVLTVVMVRRRMIGRDGEI